MPCGKRPRPLQPKHPNGPASTHLNPPLKFPAPGARIFACSAKRSEPGETGTQRDSLGTCAAFTEHGIHVSKEVLQSMATLTADLMSVLRCPVTGSPLEEVNGELVSTAPDAGGQRVRYVLEEGIPVLLPPASAAASDSVSATSN